MRPIRHRDTGRLRGIFVDFDSHELLVKALRKDGTVVRGRPVTVRPDVPNNAPPGAMRSGSMPQQRAAPESPPSSPPPTPPAGSPGASTRPKLNLAPRSAQAGAIGAQSSPSSGKPDPFGGAKPANTSEKLLQLEKLDNERRARKEENQKRRASLKASTDAMVAHIAAKRVVRDRPSGDVRASVAPTVTVVPATHSRHTNAPVVQAAVAPPQPRAAPAPGIVKPKATTANSWEDDEDDTDEDEDEDGPARPDAYNPFSLLAIDDC